MNEMYRATVAAEIQRSARTGGIEGYAAVFDAAAEISPGRWEAIARSAFEAVEGDDVAALVNHDPRLILGRSSSGTLRLALDERGVHFEIPVPPDTSYGRDLVESISRGDITGASFGVLPGEAERTTAPNGAPMVRHTKFSRWVDVSPVTFPAYGQSSVALRSVDWTREPTRRGCGLVSARSRLILAKYTDGVKR